MKVIFYKSLLSERIEISPCERILYSFLVSKSISKIDGVFDREGKWIDCEELESYINDCGGYCELCTIPNTRISEILCQTRPTIINGIKHLRELGYIYGNKIYIGNVLKKGYIELVKKEELKGILLIFYSFLYDKGMRYGCKTNICKDKLAQQFGCSVVAITKLLHRLYKKGLIRRLDDGSLLIIKQGNHESSID